MQWFFFSWAEVDSNHRSNLQQIYSLSPLATRESARLKSCQAIVHLTFTDYNIALSTWQANLL